LLLLQPPPPVGEDYTERPRVPPWYRDWALSLNTTTLFPLGLAPGENVFDLAPRPPAPLPQSWTLNLDTTTLFPTALGPGKQAYDLARGPAPPVQSWAASFDLALIGQDQIPARLVGQDPPAPPQLGFARDWALNLNTTTLFPTGGPLPVMWWDVPPSPVAPPALTWSAPQADTFLIIVAPPPGDQTFEVPRAPQLPFRDWTRANFTIVPFVAATPPPGEDFTDRPPVPPYYREWQLDDLVLTTLAPIFPAGKPVSDLPPRAPARPDASWTQFFDLNLLQPPPPVGDDYSERPQVPPYYREWALNDLLLTTLAVTLPPGDQTFETPKAPQAPFRDWTLPNFTITPFAAATPPPGRNFTDRPPPVQWYRSWELDLVDTTLFGRDASLAGKASFDLAPRGYPRPDATYTVAFQFGLVAPPLPTGAQYSGQFSALPPPPRNPALTWTFSYLLELVGQDAMLVGDQLSARPPVPPFYRDWALNLVDTTLFPPAPPIAQLDWPLPRAPFRNDQTYSLDLGQFTPAALPPGKLIYDLPRGPPRPDATWTFSYLLNLVGRDARLAGVQTSELPPRAPYRIEQTWTLDLGQFIPAPPPPTNRDWPLPTPPFRLDETFARAFTLPLRGQDAFPLLVAGAAYELSPRQKPFRIDAGWIVSPFLASFPNPPIRQYDWPLPTPPYRQPDLRSWAAWRFLGLADRVTLRLAAATYDLAPGQRPFRIEQTTAFTLPAQTRGPFRFPFNQYDWPVPVPPYRLPGLTQWAFGLEAPAFPSLVAYACTVVNAETGQTAVQAYTVSAAVAAWTATTEITPRCMGVLGTTPIQYRGATIQFATTFYDFNGNVAQPPGATVEVAYIDATEQILVTASIPMVPPGPGTAAWTAQWDSRTAGVGPVTWSVHTGSTPFAVEDGSFLLQGNAANQAAVGSF
jgi:hypothetical protein